MSGRITLDADHEMRLIIASIWVSNYAVTVEAFEKPRQRAPILSKDSFEFLSSSLSPLTVMLSRFCVWNSATSTHRFISLVRRFSSCLWLDSPIRNSCCISGNGTVCIQLGSLGIWWFECCHDLSSNQQRSLGISRINGSGVSVQEKKSSLNLHMEYKACKDKVYSEHLLITEDRTKFRRDAWLKQRLTLISCGI